MADPVWRRGFRDGLIFSTPLALGLAIVCSLAFAVLVQAGMKSCGLGPYAKTYFVREHWPNGRLRAVGNMGPGGTDLRSVGPWVYFYESGALKSEGDCGHGFRRVGIWNHYYESGPLKARANHDEGESWRWWYENGQVSAEGSFSPTAYSNARQVGARPSGVWRFFYPTGRVAAEGRYVGSGVRPKGDRSRHDALDELPLDLTEYLGGVATGTWRYWTEDGLPDYGRSGEYRDGERVSGLRDGD